MKASKQTQKIKVAIADDHALFRAGVKTALSVKKDIEFIAEANNGSQLLERLQHVHPDIILLDIQMPVMDGITVLPEIRKLYPDVRVIVLSMYNEHTIVSNLMEIGANAYLTKNSDSETIYQAIRTCYEQEYFFNDLTNKALLLNLRSKRNEVSLHDDTQLNERETKILRMMCEEKSTRDIAAVMNISPRTVEAIRDKLKLKTGARTMAGLVMYAVNHGILKETE